MNDLNLSTEATTIVRVTASSLNVRTGPSTSYPIVKTIPYNSKWYVLQISNRWYKIANNQWISSAYTALSSTIKTVQVTASSLNVRTGPSSSFPIVRSLPINSIINIYEESNNWYKVGYDQWVSKSYTSPTTVNCSSYNNNLTSWYFIYKGQGIIPDADTSINKLNGYYIFNTNKKVIKRMVNEGHIVANHTVTHPALPDLANNPAAFNAEILNVEKKYKDVTGLDMVKMLRPPSGYYSMRSLCLTQQLSYSSVFWSFGYKDWDTNDQPSPSDAFNKITTSTHPGAIFLLHAVSSTNTSILGNVIDTIRAQGYTFEQLHL